MPQEEAVERTSCPHSPARKRQSPLQRRLQEAWAWCRTAVTALGSLVSSAPWVAVVPLLLLVALVVAGELGVHYAAQVSRNQNHLWAAGVATREAQDVAMQLQNIVAPIMALGTAIKAQPDVPTIAQLYSTLALDIVSKLDVTGSVASLALAPWGVIQGIYPAFPSKDLKFNMFEDDAALAVITSSYVQGGLDNTVVLGPVISPIDGKSIFVLAQTVWIAGAAANATFGNDATFSLSYAPGMTFGNLTHPEFTTCGAACANRVRNGTLHRFWGMASGYVRTDQLASRLASLEEQTVRYKFVLFRKVDGSLGRSELKAATFSAAAAEKVMFASPASVGPRITRSDDPECADVMISSTNIIWTLCVAPLDGWDPVWLVPLQVTVVFVAALIAGLLFGMLVSQQRHAVLVRLILPDKVINHLNRGHMYKERFQQVTILFGDIVGYTNLSGELSHAQMVEVLNALYSHFDTLVDKHKLYKVGTVGDSFMCVGGAPDTCHPRDAAIRVTRMALDMVAFANQYVLQDGRNIQIRVGLSTGDITAAVVGKKVPTWFLVGDTVNVASRMESHSLPMHVHVGHTTAKLLAASPEFTLQPRGEIDIKGKGLMSTFFVWSSSKNTDQATVMLTMDDSGSHQGKPTPHDTGQDRTSLEQDLALGVGMSSDSGPLASVLNQPANSPGP